MRNVRGGWLIGVALAAYCGSAQAAAFKWLDENGGVHYGDRPPASGAESLQLSSTPAVAPAPATGERTQRMLEVFEEDRLRKREQAAERKQAREEREQQCNHARTRLSRYEAAAYLYDTDAGGRQHALTAEQRELAMQQARAAVQHWCDGDTHDMHR